MNTVEGKYYGKSSGEEIRITSADLPTILINSSRLVEYPIVCLFAIFHSAVGDHGIVYGQKFPRQYPWRTLVVKVLASHGP